jgi:hypothetical protein
MVTCLSNPAALRSRPRATTAIVKGECSTLTERITGMSIFKKHCEESERLFGASFEEVHLWLDAFMVTPEYEMRAQEEAPPRGRGTAGC